MKILKHIIFSLLCLFCLTPPIAFLQNDILDTAFQQSKNLDQVINIGNNKNAVGNEIFRGSTNIDDISFHGIKTTQTAPLLVRITQTLLRLTIALSIPIIIWIGLKIIKNGMSGGEIKESIQEVGGVLIGLALALSAVGIIYLIQSIMTQSITIGGNTSDSTSPIEKTLSGTLCTGLPANAVWNTANTINQTWNETEKTYTPTALGKYSNTSSTNTCVFTCKSGSIYDTIANTCTTTEAKNQTCTGLPTNAVWNTASTINQTWNETEKTYAPSTIGKYSDIVSKNTCVFTCKSGYIYDTSANICITKETKNQTCTGLPSNAEWNSANTINQTWNSIDKSYIPSTTGQYSEKTSTNTCVFWCKPGYYYDGNLCVMRAKKNQTCTGLPANAVWNTVSTINQIWNSDDQIYTPSIIGKYSSTSSTNTCVFTCKSGYIYSNNTCVLRIKNQTCTGLPANAVWNTASTINQIWNETEKTYTPTALGKYSETVSTNACVFTCKSGYTYKDRICQ